MKEYFLARPPLPRPLLLPLLLLLLIFLLAGCAPGDPRFGADQPPAGFFWGVWHGWIAPFALIGGFFNPAIRVYEGNNVGWWYDLGFYLAVIGGFGGLALVRRRDKD
jgi:hypothetical protein